jgi:uncharacterized protein (TIGR02246 family)
MKTDEQQIRALVDDWFTATRSGDVDTVMSLVTDDVVFLLPGRPPMRRDEFAAQSRAQGGAAAPRIEGTSEIREIVVSGDWAYMWTALSVSLAPSNGRPSIHRAGHTLTVLRRQGGRWLIARDANLLAPDTSPMHGHRG